MSTLGNSYTESVALMVGAGEQMPNQSGKIARGLRSIGLEIAKTAQETTILNTGYKDTTLALYDQNGQMKSTYDILSELYPIWQNMTDAQKSNIGIALAGKQQYEVLSATLNGFGQVLSANTIGLSASGSAMRENEKYMQSIEARTEQFKAQLQELVLGQGGLESFIKGLLDVGTAILKFANSDVGQAIIKLTLLYSTIKLITVSIESLAIVSKITYLFNAFGNSAFTATVGVKGLTGALAVLKLDPIILGLTALVAVIYVAHNAIEKQKELVAELEESTKSLGQELSSLKDKEKPSQEEQDRIAYLEKRIQLEKDLLNATQNRLGADSGETPSAPQTYSDARQAFKVHQETGSQNPNAPSIQVQESDISAYMRLREEIDSYNDSSEKGLKILEEKQNKSQTYLSSLETERDNLSKLKEEQGFLSEREEEYLRILEKNIGVKEKSSEEMSSYAEIVAQFGEESQEATEYMQELQKAYDDAIGGFSDIQSSYDTLISAMDEYNETGVYSLDTVSKLLALDSQYAGALQVVNGQMTINEEAIRNKVLAQAEEARQTIYNTAIEKLNALASAESGEASALAGDDHSNATTGINAETEALGANTTAKLQNAIADAKGRGAGTDEINQVLGEMSDQLALVNKATLNMGVNFEGSMGKAGSSASKASSATDKLQSSVESLLKEHLSDEIDKLKKAEEEEVDVLNKRIDLLEKNRDTQLDSIDAQIDGIEKLQDAEESRIDNEISQLEKQKSAVEDYYDAQISALEKANTERERQIKLMELEEALAKAKSSKVMVMTDAGWQYGQDESAVSSAEQNLSDYQSELAYTTQIEQLEALKASAVANIDSQIAKWEEYKTTMQNNYASQISALEMYRTTVEQSYATQIDTLEANIETIQEQYALQIEQLETFKDNVDEFVEGLSSAEQQRLENQLNQIKATASNYETDLTNLKEYVNKFNAILAQKGSAGATVTTGTSVGSSTANSQKARGYANGVASVGSNQVAMIGDDPNNRELVIGSKLNGTATMLSQGSGVVNAQSTRTLAGLLNTLGSSMGMNGQTIGTSTVNTSNASSQNISIANITLPSVTNAQSFVDELKGFSANMAQYAYSNG